MVKEQFAVDHLSGFRADVVDLAVVAVLLDGDFIDGIIHCAGFDFDVVFLFELDGDLGVHRRALNECRVAGRRTGVGIVAVNIARFPDARGVELVQGHAAAVGIDALGGHDTRGMKPQGGCIIIEGYRFVAGEIDVHLAAKRSCRGFVTGVLHRIGVYRLSVFIGDKGALAIVVGDGQLHPRRRSAVKVRKRHRDGRCRVVECVERAVISDVERVKRLFLLRHAQRTVLIDKTRLVRQRKGDIRGNPVLNREAAAEAAILVNGDAHTRIVARNGQRQRIGQGLTLIGASEHAMEIDGIVGEIDLTVGIEIGAAGITLRFRTGSRTDNQRMTVVGNRHQRRVGRILGDNHRKTVCVGFDLIIGIGQKFLGMPHRVFKGCGSDLGTRDSTTILGPTIVGATIPGGMYPDKRIGTVLRTHALGIRTERGDL